jgi:hypothetical protein
VVNPCVPSPCGPYSECRDRGGYPSCTCQTGYVGSAPNCRPECSINAECASNLACMREKCRDPCPGSCGAGAVCNVMNHMPVCTCPEGYTGDPFTNCYPKPPERKPDIYYDISILKSELYSLYPCHGLVLQRSKRKRPILATLLHVVRTLNVEMECVPACPNIKGTPIPGVARNASLTTIVPATRLVSGTNAQTRVPEPVDKTHVAKS